ncbi:hypothetical protein KNE206_20800 [Kitasatospora sp. NE20-6]
MPEPDTVARTVPFATVAVRVRVALAAELVPESRVVYARAAPPNRATPSAKLTSTAPRRRGSTFMADSFARCSCTFLAPGWEPAEPSNTDNPSVPGQEGDARYLVLMNR